ncbi:unnamed protein product [Lactuca virosa]|uniref:DUF659 domain-containing protein n=1 Tax=Lactuca virosa TaxID=75947 RepID=A0AAU9NPU5_9ASTR|nr:unnamed protein product [Lactuca virosa]
MNAWDKIATWAFSVGLPFNAVRDESFQDMINSIGEYGRGMPTPSYHNIRVTLMKKRLEDTQKFVDSFRPHWEEYRYNGSNFKAVGKILEEQHPKLFWTPCAAHCVNLMIGDIGEKIPKIKTALTDARAILVYIYNHGRILNLMRKLTKNKELHRSCVTRFATQFYTIQSIHDNRHHIQLHSKKRNCLLQQKLNDLVFIQYNTRLQRRFNSLKANKSLDPILLRDVDEKDDWVIPTEVELQEFVDGRDGLLWSAVREPMGGTEEVGVTTRSKRDRYRDDEDDDDIRVEVEDLDEQLDALGDVGSEEDFMSYN